MDADLAYRSAGELTSLIRAGDVSTAEVIAHALARIDEVGAELNCFTAVWHEDALETARAADDAVASGAPLGPLHGVPVAVKDTTPVGGRRTTLGSYTHEHWVPERDAYVVAALRRAGAVIVAQTTAPEFAHSLITDSPLWGPTRNPWDLTRTTGGSSGGSGAAVASGCVPLAEGTDMGGSVRIPAAWCGVVGSEARPRSHPDGLVAEPVRQHQPSRSARPLRRRRPVVPRRDAGSGRRRHHVGHDATRPLGADRGRRQRSAARIERRPRLLGGGPGDRVGGPDARPTPCGVPVPRSWRSTSQ